jgi:hypothetical protein
LACACEGLPQPRLGALTLAGAQDL